jgi:hypothetical protein
MVLGARTRDGRGCVLRYVSDDLLKWEYEKTYWGDDGSYMWECPDEFVLGTKRFLSVSPQGLTHGKYLSQNIYSSGYFSLEGDSPVTYREWDAGFDFYAPQSFIAPDGRRILIGWEGIGDIPYTNPTIGLGWQHCLTLPRELSLSENGYIRQMPVRELRKLRKKETEVISGGSRDQSLLPLLIAEGADLVVGAPHLVGAGPLAVLGFQVDLSSGELAEVIGIDQRSVEGDLVHRLARLFKSGQRQFLSILHNVSPVLSFQNINRISHLQTGRG